MLRSTLTAAVALSALTAGSAIAECTARMDTIDKDYGEFISSETRSNTENGRVIRDLRNAARRLSVQGNEEGCEAVVAAIDEVVTGYKTNAGESPAPASSIADPDSHRADIEKRVVAIKEAGTDLDTSNLVGINVYNYKDEFLGEVDGMLIKDGQAPTHLIVGHGGFWNIGDEEAAIPLDEMKWDPEWEVFYVDLTEEQLDKAPDYDLANGQWTVDGNDDYYKKLFE